MSDSAFPPGLRLRRALLDRLDAIAAEILTLRRLLHDLNRTGLTRTFNDLHSVLTAVETVLADHAAGQCTNIADELAALLSASQAIEVSAIDPETGEESYNLQQLDNAQSRLVRALLRALEAARATGIVPTDVALLPGGQTLVVPRSGNEDLLRDIANNFDIVAKRLEALEAVKAEPSVILQQGNFIAFYIGRMNVQIDLVKLQLKVGEHTIDFAALARAGVAMAELTGDFFATITAWAGQVSERVTAAARTVNQAVVVVSRGLGRAIRTILARRSAEAPVAVPEPPAREGPPPDFDLDQATKMILEGKVPPTTWWPHITRLDLSGSSGEVRKFSDLAPLQALTNLESLVCWNTQVSDLAPLQALTSLEMLNCSHTQVSDLAPLQALTNLETLYCSGTQLSDLAPLQALTNLETLYCSGTQVSNLAPLQALTNLESLYCSGTQVSDLASLQALTNLRTLDCSDTQVSDLAPLQALTNLETLYCSGTQVSDLAPLQALTNLERLNCSATPVSDLAPLQELTNLEALDCFGTQVSDLAPLQALTNLERLNCSFTQVSGLAPLQELTNLEMLYCWNTQVSDLAPLRALTNLRTLNCSGTQVSDLAPLQALTNLETLDIRATRVTDASVLKHLSKLTILGGPGETGAVSVAIRRGRQFLGRVLRRTKE